jgi:branched-chain amino acid transport system substrate-binding protein
MNTRALKSFFFGILILGLTSCSHRTEPEVAPPAKPVTPQVKPVKPAPVKKQEPTGPQTHKVGLLLPLSGPQADLGKGMLQAAELALFETGTTNVTLLPQDTNKGAQVAVQKALDQGAELLLGPLFAADVQAVKPIARGRNISIVSFSTDHTIAGQGAYVLGFLPSQQIQRVASYAKEKGQTKVAAFTPNDQYGRLVDQTLKSLASNGSIQLLGITHYSRGDILEGNPGNAQLLEEMTSYKSKGVDAVIIPEGGENLAHLMRLLSPQKPFTVLGSGQWDASETRSVPGIEGGIFASTDTLERQSFESRFRQAYGHTPPRLATLAYDATALAIALSDKGYTAQNLTFSQGFAGIDGLFRLTPQGLNERGLAVLEVNSSGFKTISPAPSSF